MISPLKHVHFDSIKCKYVADNRKNRRRLEKQGDLLHLLKTSTFMKRFRSKLNKLKLGNIIHLSITEIKKQYGKDCIARFGTDVLNAIHDKRVMMKIGNKRVPFNIDNIRNLSKWLL